MLTQRCETGQIFLGDLRTTDKSVSELVDYLESQSVHPSIHPSNCTQDRLRILGLEITD